MLPHVLTKVVTDFRPFRILPEHLPGAQQVTEQPSPLFLYHPLLLIVRDSHFYHVPDELCLRAVVPEVIVLRYLAYHDVLPSGYLYRSADITLRICLGEVSEIGVVHGPAHDIQGCDESVQVDGCGCGRKWGYLRSGLRNDELWPSTEHSLV